MKIALVFPELPPVLDGIGDYTAQLAKAFVRIPEMQGEANSVEIHTAVAHPEPIEGVEVISNFSIGDAGNLNGLIDGLQRSRPDWILLQYNPFSYGKWGLNLALPKALKEVKKRLPAVRLAIMVHEPFVPIESAKTLVMTSWQRWQLWQLGNMADLVYFSIEPWVNRFSGWFKKKSVQHLPVGSNMPRIESSPDETRTKLGIAEDAFVIGIFGTLHPSRLMHFIHQAMTDLKAAGVDPVVLYIGPHGKQAKEALPHVSLIDSGKLSPEDVSSHFQVMDLYLAPFRKGVSARRGSFLVGIQHGIATVSTHGIHTDSFIKNEDKAAFLLASDQDKNAFSGLVKQLALSHEDRQKVATTGRQFFDLHFSWPRIAERQYGDMAAFGSASGHKGPQPVLQKG